MKNRKSIFVLLALIFSLSLLLFGCGQQSNGSDQNASDNSDTNEAADTQPVVLTVGATPVPHAEILKFIQPILQEKGIELKIVEFTDYVLPNTALENKELDANYFQHVPYLDDFNQKNNTHLSATVPVHFEPLGLYPGKTKSLDEIKQGDSIAVPNDTTNEARALLLLESAGLIKIKEGSGLNATVKDIVENPHEIQIKELEAAQISRSLPDVNLAVINGNYAVEAGLDVTKDALKSENKDSLAAQTFANIVVVRTGDENRPEIKTLNEVITSPEVRDFINEKYQGTVIPVF
ncbi:MetQ/NlpA family ABC transporter substrate-binding protein [Candidatus Formimonas warabiya]|uniref:Lipoprotein n=1 Tax=Formimonas warabiya TaxID=1761012 RepID=A0A3G1L041_FORW1|nr:MetQ/NlpA family ABC transporter substrate-binding protein [Candidatus Formimonas warabiya]ATW28027.1 methionine ABC transporter substrate-binding protein [Candidatus Formimonas warabiya]